MCRTVVHLTSFVLNAEWNLNLIWKLPRNLCLQSFVGLLFGNYKIEIISGILRTYHIDFRMMVCFKLSLFLVICTTLLENPASANTVTFMSATGKWKEETTVISISLSLDLSDWFKEKVSDAEKCGPRIGIFIGNTSAQKGGGERFNQLTKSGNVFSL